MHRTTRARLEEVNHHLVCVLCGGYFIDATSIIECLHSFCRTCIVTYLETSKYCPICDVQVHKTRPLLNIRADKTLQNLVYKLVPGLFEDEMRRRREFYASRSEGRVEMCLEARGEAVMEKEVVRPDDNISLCLQMSRNGLPPDSDDDDNKPADVRYLLCPSAMTVAQLKKFIRIKFSLPEFYKIDMFHTEEALTDTFTLLDIAYLYTWRRKAPLRLFYIVDEKPFKKRKSSAGKTSRDLEVGDEAKKVKMENNVDEDALSKEPMKAIGSVCENSDMFSDISDYEPFPHPDYSQQIHITSEGSDSTITYVDVEETLSKSKRPVENDTCSDKVCDLKKPKEIVNDIVTEHAKPPNQSRAKEIVQEQLEKIGIEQSKEIEKHVHPVKDHTVKTKPEVMVERHSESNAKSKEVCAKQEVVKDVPNDTNSRSKNHPEPKDFTKLDVKHETQTQNVETISTKFDQTKLSSKDKCDMFAGTKVGTKVPNGISKEKEVSRNSISRTSYIGYSPAKIWQKPNGFNRVRKDNVVSVNGLKPHKTMSKLPKFDDRVNNNTIVEGPMSNGIDQRMSMEVKSEPLDLSENSRRKSIGPIYVSDSDL